MNEKTIHYCWFGGNELPESAIKCIESWNKYCPDYKVKRWDESNFDCDICSYVKEAYKCRRWAFVSDYARFWILYNYGGVYFDTDVELINPIDDLIELGPFMGVERELDFSRLKDKDYAYYRSNFFVAPGLGMYAMPGQELYAEILNYYDNVHFVKEDGREDITTVVDIVSEIIKKHSIDAVDEDKIKVSNTFLYRKDYFCPIDYRTGKMSITNNTRSIHHYNASWMTENELLVQKAYISAKSKYGEKLGRFIGYFKSVFLRRKMR